MKKSLLVCSVLLVYSCNNSEPEDKITGAYVRQYSFEQSNIQTGKVLGLSTIRDTFYIESADGGYQVIQKKWRSNDYDMKGWTEQLHSTDRQRSPYLAKYNPSDHTLTSLDNSYQPITLDLEGGQLFLSPRKENAYKKIAK